MPLLFITGTDTGVGKTLITALLLAHLRQRGVKALAMKPFCSGSRDDVRLLQTIQKHELSNGKMNPFYFRAPIAPLVAARRAKRKEITIEQVLDSIATVASKCEWLLVEGAGGLLAPLGPKLSALELIEALNCRVCVVAANRLGTLNHTLLTIRAIPPQLRPMTTIVLNWVSPRADLAIRTNRAILSELIAPRPVISIPWLGLHARTAASVRKHSRVLAATLTRIAR